MNHPDQFSPPHVETEHGISLRRFDAALSLLVERTNHPNAVPQLPQVNTANSDWQRFSYKVLPAAGRLPEMWFGCGINEPLPESGRLAHTILRRHILRETGEIPVVSKILCVAFVGVLRLQRRLTTRESKLALSDRIGIALHKTVMKALCFSSRLGI